MEQMSEIHAFVNVFSGMLTVTPDNLLPEDKNSTCVKEEPGDYCFLAGGLFVQVWLRPFGHPVCKYSVVIEPFVLHVCVCVCVYV